MDKKWLAMSTAGRWSVCPGSAKVSTGAIREAPGAEEDTPAGEGAKAHRIAKNALLYLAGKITRRELQDRTIPEEPPGEMMSAVNAYVKELKSRPGKIYPEVYLEYNGCRGYADAIIYSKNHPLIIADFKYGAHEAVSARQNAQLTLYALAAAEKAGITDTGTEIIQLIVQPRMPHKTDEVHVALGALQDYYNDKIAPTEERILSGAGAYYQIGDCRHCPKYAGCPAWAREAGAAAVALTGEITKSDREYLLDYGPGIIKATDAFLRAEAERAERDGCPDGYELTGRVIRTIPQEMREAAAEALLDAGADPEDIYKPAALKALSDIEGYLTQEQQDALAPYIQYVQQQQRLKRITGHDNPQTVS